MAFEKAVLEELSNRITGSPRLRSAVDFSKLSSFYGSRFTTPKDAVTGYPVKTKAYSLGTLSHYMENMIYEYQN